MCLCMCVCVRVCVCVCVCVLFNLAIWMPDGIEYKYVRNKTYHGTRVRTMVHVDVHGGTMDEYTCTMLHGMEAIPMVPAFHWYTYTILLEYHGSSSYCHTMVEYVL
jgi:hypothetical protein